MLVSMTGYSNKTFDVEIKPGQQVSISVELKTLNSRFFEMTSRVPSVLNFLETTILALLKKKFVRGRVYLTMHIESYEETFETIRPSIKTAQGYITALRAIQQKSQMPGEVTISDLVALPNIFVSEKAGISPDAKQTILTGVEAVADTLVEVRKAEGAHLHQDLNERVSACEHNIERIALNYDQHMESHKKLVTTTLVAAQTGDDEAKNKLDDLYTLMNKIDISEEITRFKSHLFTIKDILKSESMEKGKRCDFTVQELLRETNTIAAKASHFDISTSAVDIKVELEKAREQIQNVL